MSDAPTPATTRAATVTLDAALEHGGPLFGGGDAGDGIIRIPRRLVEAIGWEPGARLRVTVITLDERGRAPRALCVERARALRTERT